MASKFFNHGTLERNVSLLGIAALITVAIGGIVEIAPLFWIDNTIEKVEGMRPYTPLELAGRNIYIREGCYNCHSQMIRPFRDEVERYGHYSLAAESMYDHPFQWGSKRTGPDLARVGGRYSDEWHVQHLKDPRAVVPESIMPTYPFLAERDLKPGDMRADLKALTRVGVPYSDADISKANDDLAAQALQPVDADRSAARQHHAVEHPRRHAHDRGAEGAGAGREADNSGSRQGSLPTRVLHDVANCCLLVSSLLLV